MVYRMLLMLSIIAFFPLFADAQPLSFTPPHLALIERAPGSSILGGLYYYKGQRLNSPFSLEVPIHELNDPVASRHFRRFRTWTTVGRLTGLASVAYVLFNRTPDQRTRRAVYVGSLVASVGFTLVSNRQIQRAVGRYNQVVGSPRIGFGVSQLEIGGLATGVLVQFPLN